MARKLGYAGVESYQAGRYPTATEQLERAYAVLRVPSIGLWSARALAQTGKLVEASERYLELSRLELGEGDQRVQKRALEDAAKGLAELNKRLPSITVTVEGAKANEVTLALDGAAFSSAMLNEARPVNPGRHVVTGSRGSERVETALQVGEAENGQAKLMFHASAGAPAAMKAAPSQAALAMPIGPVPEVSASSWNAGKTTAVALGVLAVAGGVVAAVELSTFHSKQSEGDSKCPNQQCDDPVALSASNQLRPLVWGTQMASNAWFTGSCTFDGPILANHVALVLGLSGDPWSGKVFFDDVQIN